MKRAALIAKLPPNVQANAATLDDADLSRLVAALADDDTADTDPDGVESQFGHMTFRPTGNGR